MYPCLALVRSTFFWPEVILSIDCSFRLTLTNVDYNTCDSKIGHDDFVGRQGNLDLFRCRFILRIPLFRLLLCLRCEEGRLVDFYGSAQKLFRIAVIQRQIFPRSCQMIAFMVCFERHTSSRYVSQIQDIFLNRND